MDFDDLEDSKSLRDEMAMAAVSGILANPDPNAQVAYMSPDDFADMAYEVADAMMVRRQGKRKMFSLFPMEDVSSEDLADVS